MLCAKMLHSFFFFSEFRKRGKTALFSLSSVVCFRSLIFFFTALNHQTNKCSGAHKVEILILQSFSFKYIFFFLNALTHHKDPHKDIIGGYSILFFFLLNVLTFQRLSTSFFFCVCFFPLPLPCSLATKSTEEERGGGKATCFFIKKEKNETCCDNKSSWLTMIELGPLAHCGNITNQNGERGERKCINNGGISKQARRKLYKQH